MVEVVAPDGRWELWAAATAHDKAIAAVRKAIPEDWDATLSNQRLHVGPKLEGLRYGEVRKVRP